MKKIRRYTEWQGMPYKEKSQYEEFQKISILAGQAGIPKLIVDEAIRHYKRISEAMSFRGLNRDGVIAASIYIASRINAYPRTAKEIAVIFHLDNTSATKGCKKAMFIINELENDTNDSSKSNIGNDYSKTVYCETTPLSFIDRYCSKLNMNIELTKLSKFIAIRIQNNNIIPENTPHSIAAGIIYFIAVHCNLYITKRDVSQISEISEVTINKCYKKIDLLKNELLPKSILIKFKK
jgi:transcription initiation factor TFIIB